MLKKKKKPTNKREKRERKTTSACAGFEKNTLLDNKQASWEGAAGSLWRGRARCSAAPSGGCSPAWSRSAEASPGVGTWGLDEGQFSKGDLQSQAHSVVIQVEAWKTTHPFWKALSPLVASDEDTKKKKKKAKEENRVAHPLYLCCVILSLRG